MGNHEKKGRRLLTPLRQLKSKMNIREKWELLVKTHQSRLKNFEPKIRFRLEKDKYVIKTVENFDELEQVLRLRHEVFLEECAGQRHLTGLDFDEYDLLCDHLVVIDSEKDEVLGTYRVICSRFSEKFYTSSEFDISNLLALNGVKLELGRACIRKTHRTGIVIQLLWRAIAQYIKESKADYLFGCASVFTQKPVEAAAIQLYLKKRGALTDEALVQPIGKYIDSQVEECVEFLSRPEFGFDPDAASKMVPALFKSYLKLGSKICGLPANDRKFQCYDYVTLQEIKAFGQSIEKKYGL